MRQAVVLQSYSAQTAAVNIFVSFHCGKAAHQRKRKKDRMIAVTSPKPGSSFKICVGERESGVKMKFSSSQIFF